MVEETPGGLLIGLIYLMKSKGTEILEGQFIGYKFKIEKIKKP